MIRKFHEQGFSLIEMILFIVVTGIAMLGIVPLYNNVLANLHLISDTMQAEYLGLEMVERLTATYFNAPVGAPAGSRNFVGITSANFPSETAIDMGAGLKFDRTVTVEGMVPGQTPNPCTGSAYNGESYKCVIVVVTPNGSNQILFKSTQGFSDL